MDTGCVDNRPDKAHLLVLRRFQRQ